MKAYRAEQPEILRSAVLVWWNTIRSEPVNINGKTRLITCADRGMNVLAYGGNTSGNIDVAACLTAKGKRIDFEVETFAVHGTQDPDTNRELAHAFRRNNGQENACIAFE
jgi:hypothetical protein